MNGSNLFSSLQYSCNKLTVTEIEIQSLSASQEEIENCLSTLLFNI